MQRCFPAKFKAKLTDESVGRINKALVDSEYQEELKQNILGFSSVLNAPHYSLDEYINAVKYISFTMMGDTNVKAWAKVFPDRYVRLVEKGIEGKDINAHVRHFNKTALVNAVREQSLVPSHILNADLFQEALNKQAFLMRNAASERVQREAADSLLTHLKRPETQRVELNVGIKEDSMLTELKDITHALAAQQMKLIDSGAYTAKDIAHQEILTVNQDGEVIE